MRTPFNSRAIRRATCRSFWRPSVRSFPRNNAGQFGYKPKCRTALSWEVTGRFGGTKQSGQSTKQSLEFIRFKDCRFNLQSRAREWHEGQIRFDRAL